MIKQREHRNDYLSIICIMLFFLFVCVFSKHSEVSAAKDHHHELVAKTHTSYSDAALNDYQQYTFQKSLFPSINKISFIFNKDFKIFADNKSVNQRIILLRKTALHLKPIILHKFYYRYFYIDTEDLPILS